MNKKIILLVVSAILVAILVTVGVTFHEWGNETTDTEGQTARPPVVLTRPEATKPSETDTVITAPAPYDGMTFTVLLAENAELYFGEFDGGDNVNEKAYARNLLLCEEFGVSMVFRYSLGIYDEYYAQSNAGKIDIDLICMNMQKDGARFMMSGSIDDVLADTESADFPFPDVYDNLYAVNGRSFFLIGGATPSYPLANRFLRVEKDSYALEQLKTLASSGILTYENMFSTLKNVGATLSLDGDSLHALAAKDGIFVFSDSGEPQILTEVYVENINKLSGFKSQISEADGATLGEVSVGTPVKDGEFIYLPLPKATVEESYTATVDPSCLYPLAVPSNLDNREKTYAILERMFELSDGLPAAVCEEYGIELPYEDDGIGFCFYDLFGWGDFSKHSYSAFGSGSTSSLANKLTAPEKAALQALSILFERCS